MDVIRTEQKVIKVKFQVRIMRQNSSQKTRFGTTYEIKTLIFTNFMLRVLLLFKINLFVRN